MSEYRLLMTAAVGTVVAILATFAAVFFFANSNQPVALVALIVATIAAVITGLVSQRATGLRLARHKRELAEGEQKIADLLREAAEHKQQGEVEK